MLHIKNEFCEICNINVLLLDIYRLFLVQNEAAILV